MSEKVYSDWVQKQKTTGATVKKAGNNYYLYKHSSKRVHGKKNPVPVDTYIGKITPEGVEKSGSKRAAVNDAEVIVKEFGFSRAVEVLCPARWKEPLGKNWQEVLDAEEMLDYKRKHWTIENGLHYVPDETFGEDKSTVKQGKNTMSILRKCAYNIARLLQMGNPEGQGGIPDIIDDVCDNLELGFQMIFNPIPSRY